MQMPERVYAREWFSAVGERVIFAGKLAASFVAAATALFPLAATYFKVEAMQQQQQQQVMQQQVMQQQQQVMQQQQQVMMQKIDDLSFKLDRKK
jgi:hypothetical protein